MKITDLIVSGVTHDHMIFLVGVACLMVTVSGKSFLAKVTPQRGNTGASPQTHVPLAGIHTQVEIS